MAVNSIDFVLFFILVFLVYWGVADRYKIIVLLGASYIVCASYNFASLIWILLATFGSYLIGRCLGKRKRNAIVFFAGLGLFVSCFILVKYSDFIQKQINIFWPIGNRDAVFHIIAPIGISFYMFQIVSYLTDVYKGKIPAEKNYIKYSLYLSFFPKLLAGPIERGDTFLPQLKQEFKFDEKRAIFGVRQIIWGYFKKIVLADTLAKGVDTVYNNVHGFRGGIFILATILFTIQIYCDFSGYSDIAIGMGKMFGVDLMDNFNTPYFSKSIKEFWSRWHISLSTWLKDYIYIPLGGNRKGILRKNVNLMITFLISGLWHGVGWNYLAWGGIHGCYQILGNVFPSKEGRQNNKIMRAVEITVTFFLVSFAWIFFRANSLPDAMYIITHMFDGIGNWTEYCNDFKAALVINNTGILILAGEILILFCHDLCKYSSTLKLKLIVLSEKYSFIVRISYLLLLLCVLTLCMKRTEAAFIYAQF